MYTRIALLLAVILVSCKDDSQKQFFQEEKMEKESIQLPTFEWYTDTVLHYVDAMVVINPTTKVVKWYTIGFKPNSSGQILLRTEDDRTYTVNLPTPADVAATTSLMQNAYVRFDTAQQQIYAYKAAISDSVHKKRAF